MTDRTIYKLFINGAWRVGGGAETLPLIDPATEQDFADVAVATTADLDDALKAAQSSLAAWAATPAATRGALLVHASEIMQGRIEEAAAALSREQGKTIAEARGEYARVVETLAWNGNHAEELTAPIPMGPTRAIVPQPIGVVAAFTPWNYPAVLNARKLAAPLAAGCPVILKGAEETPSSGVFIIEALHEAGVPAGVIGLVYGHPPMISEHLLASRDVRALTFTGSTPVGKLLARQAATNLQRCVLELGGHSPVVVFEDADLDHAVAAITEYKFECAGQSCNAPSRLLVARPLYAAFLEKIVAAAKAIRIGAPDDATTEMGPMANPRRIEAMEQLTRDAVARGAVLHTGGARLDRPGYYWPPTVMSDVPHDARVLTEEPFGPILTVAPFDTIEEAIEAANATEYGLASYFFSHSPEIQKRMIDSLTAGAVAMNYLKGVSADAPNAGVAQSGYGAEGGAEGLREFQNLKLVNAQEPLPLGG